jgi:aspartyl-tRNA(Asn)/glutamyl-tRNA(Gln) amidotransferase subunit A
VADAAFAFSALDDHCHRAPLDRMCENAHPSLLRIGVLDDYFWAECEPGIAEGVKTALEELRSHGARFEECRLQTVQQLQEVSRDWDWGVSAVELLEFLQSELPEWIATLHPGARRQLESQQHLTAIDYLHRRRLLTRLAAETDQLLTDFDVVVCPTSPISPPLVDKLFDPDTYRRISRLAARNTCVVNLLDLCALTMPVALDPAGLPVGIQLIARSRREETLLAVASACERVWGTGVERLGIAPLMAAI